MCGGDQRRWRRWFDGFCIGSHQFRTERLRGGVGGERGDARDAALRLAAEGGEFAQAGLELLLGGDGRRCGGVEVLRGLEAEDACALFDLIGAVEQGHDGEDHATVLRAISVDDCGEVEGSIDGKIESGLEEVLEERDDSGWSCVDVFDEDLGIIGRLGDGDGAGVKEVGGLEGEGVDDGETPSHVGDEAFAFLVVANVVAEQFGVFAFEFEGAEAAVFLEKFLGREEFAGRCGGDFEAARRLNFLEFLEEGVGARFFGVAEDVEATKPAGECACDEKEDENRPEEEAVVIARRWIFLESVKVGRHWELR